MMKALLALLLSCLAVEALAAPASPISTDTVWTGPVEVEGTLDVEAGATLVVLPGTTVRFGLDATLRVRGILVAQGNESEPVTFTSAGSEPKPGDWKGIRFEGTPNLANRLRYCRVEYADDAIHAENSIVMLEDATLRHNRTGVRGSRAVKGGLFRCEVSENQVGVSLDQTSDFDLENVKLTGNARAGVVCGSRSSPRISWSEIRGSGGTGIRCLQGSAPAIRSTRVVGHEIGIEIDQGSNPALERNEIRGNRTGVSVSRLCFPVVSGNVIVGNGVGVVCDYAAYPRLRGNDLSGNERFALAMGDHQSVRVERVFSARRGQALPELLVSLLLQPSGTLAPDPFRPALGWKVDASGNWWGREATASLETAGPSPNAPFIEDGRDKPTVDYRGRPFPRDVAVFEPWAKEPLAGVGPTPAPDSGIRGRVMSEGKPVAGVRVHAYLDAAGQFRGCGYWFTPPTGVDGNFVLHLRPGRYYLVAKKASPPLPEAEPGTDDLFGYYGGSPVTVVERGFAQATVPVFRRRPVEILPRPGQSALLEGVVLGPSGSEQGASLYAYPTAASDFRGPDISGPGGSVPGGSGADGRFAVELPAGTYFLAGARRRGGAPLGPLRAGDLYGYFDGNPVRLDAGTRVRVVLQLAEKTRESAPSGACAPGGTGVRGTLRDPSGAPIRGAFAYATPDPNLIGTMPPYRSQPTGEDGTYCIGLPEGGTYYVGARSGHGGPPQLGEWQGIYGGDRIRPLPVEKGHVVEGLDLTVRRME